VGLTTPGVTPITHLIKRGAAVAWRSLGGEIVKELRWQVHGEFLAKMQIVEELEVIVEVRGAGNPYTADCGRRCQEPT